MENRDELLVAVESFFRDMKRHGYFCESHSQRRFQFKLMCIRVSKRGRGRHGLYVRYKLWRHGLRLATLALAQAKENPYCGVGVFYAELLTEPKCVYFRK